MKWITDIIKTYKKGLLYDELLSKSSEQSQKETALIEQINDLQTNKELLKKEIKTLLSEGKIDVQSLKNYYENKYGKAIWLYEYDNSGTRKDVKGALRILDEEPLKKLSNKIIKRYNLKTRTPPQKIVEKIMRYFILRKEWTYKSDTYEFWTPANISCETRTGDCDDLAILMHNMIYYVFEKLGLSDYYWRIKLCASGILNQGGHAFNIWLHEDGEWYVVESTYDLVGSWKKTWLKTPIKNNNLYQNYWGFARKDRSWKGKLSSLEPYRDD